MVIIVVAVRFISEQGNRKGNKSDCDVVDKCGRGNDNNE